MTRRLFVLLCIALFTTPALGQGKRPLNADDIFNVREVRDPQRSPDGQWVAYTVTSSIQATDKNDTDVWMVKLGRQRADSTDVHTRQRVAAAMEPRRQGSVFVSSRQEAKKAQVWLLNRTGGEAKQAADAKGGVSDYAWAPDSKRLVLVVQRSRSDGSRGRR